MRRARSERRFSLVGAIISTGFYSGDRVVVGLWSSTPIGALTDVMWSDPEGVRTLYVPTDEAAAFVGGVYEFDRVVVTDIAVEAGASHLRLEFDGRRLDLAAGRGIRIPFKLRPAWFTRFVEAPVARLLMGVVAYGTSPTGVLEWYRADRWRPLRRAVGTIDDMPLGSMEPVDPPTGFGFSEPPARPSWVDVRPLLEYPLDHPWLVAQG